MNVAAISGRFAKKSVFVTGHTGFKGAWLVAWLRHLGAEVHGYALDPEGTPNLFDLAKVELASDTRADVRDPAALRRALEAAAPELVLHLAAQPLVRRSYREPCETFATNVMGTVNLLEACRTVASVKRIVAVTTDKVYENREWLWGYREDEPLGGRDPYSASKACAEIAVSAFRQSFFSEPGTAAVASARAGNVVGGGDFCEDRIVPDIVRAVMRGVPLFIRNPRATRPWQHVLDALHGYLVLAARLEAEPAAFSRAYNFGPNDVESVNVGELARRIVARLGKGELSIAPPDQAAPHEAAALRLDSARAKAELGWRPVLDLDATVDFTADFYARFMADPSTVPALLDEQIARFEVLAALTEDPTDAAR